MQTITTIGLDIAKSVFQVHGVDAGGQVVIRRQLKRRYVLAFFQKLTPCLVGIEACASSHHWSRELQALGHKVRLMPPAYVKSARAMRMSLVGMVFLGASGHQQCSSLTLGLPSTR
jgi:transposase